MVSGDQCQAAPGISGLRQPDRGDRKAASRKLRAGWRLIAQRPSEFTQMKKAAWFPRRPFLSYGGATLTGDFRTSAPGAYLLAVSYSGAAANRGSRELLPEPMRWSPISARWLY